MTVSRAVNPYTVGRKASSKQSTSTTSSTSSTGIISMHEPPKPKPPAAVSGGRENKETNAPKVHHASVGNNSSNSNTQQPRSWHTMFESTNGGTGNGTGTTFKGTAGATSKNTKVKVNVVSAAKSAKAAKAAKASSQQSQQQQHQQQQQQQSSQGVQLKAKLRKDIENLKRAKLLHKQRLEEEKRKKVLEKQQRKQKAAAELIWKQNKKLQEERAAEVELQQRKEQDQEAAAELIQQQDKKLRDEQAEQRLSETRPAPVPPGGDYILHVPTQSNGIFSPAAALPYDPSHQYQAQAQTVTSAIPTYQQQWQVPTPSVYTSTAPPLPTPPPLSFGFGNAAHFQHHPSSHVPPISYTPVGGAGDGDGVGSWNPNPMYPVHMASQQQQQQQQQPPSPAFADSQHVTPSPAMLVSEQQPFANQNNYYHTATPLSTMHSTQLPTPHTTQTTSPPASASFDDKTHHSAAKRILMQQVKESSFTGRVANTGPHWTPNHHAYDYGYGWQAKSVAAPHAHALVYAKNEASVPHTNTDQVKHHLSSSNSVVQNKYNVKGTKTADHSLSCSPDVPAPKMETNVATPQNGDTLHNTDQSLLLQNSMDNTTTTTTSKDVPTATIVVQDSREATAAGSTSMPNNFTPSLMVADVGERADTKHAELELPVPPDHNPATMPRPTLSFPDQGQGGQSSFVPQPMQYGTPSPLIGQQQQQHYPNPMLGHDGMNQYGGYQPYAGSQYPNRLTPQSQQLWDLQQHQHQLPQSWAMQQQQQQPQSWAMEQQQQQPQLWAMQHQLYPPMYQQAPSSYRMPPVVPSGRSTTKQPPRPRPVVVAPNRGAERLAKVLESPSPFLLTHALLPFTITMVKKPGESFGATIKNETESALVEPEWLDKMSGETVGKFKPKSPVQEPVQPVEMKLNDPAIEARLDDSVVETKVEAVVSSGKADTSATVAVPLQIGEKLDDAPSSGGIAPAAGDAKGVDTQKAEIVNPRKARRTRAFFAAMTVLNPTIQNQRLASPDPSKRLMEGDILLVINGNNTAGLTFHEACTLFASCNQVADDGMVHCTVTIARRKPKSLKMTVLPAPSKLLAPLQAMGPAVREFDFSPLKPLEWSIFAISLLKAVCDSKRQLGRPILDSLLQSVTSLDPALSSRSFSTLKDAWSSIAQGLERHMVEKALNFWKSQWKNEPSEVKSSGMEYLTDAQRSSMRAAPRPPKGCRCGKIDHDYCHDHRCPLYSDIRAFDPVSAESKESGPKRTMSKLPRDLNTVETGFKDRFVRLQAEKEAQEAEARFVDRMEDLQIKKHSKAVFAPSLAAMVLCTVHELQGYFKDDVIEPASPAVEGEISRVVVPMNVKDSDDDSDDEDMPLAALGKRTLDSASAANKKQKRDLVVRRKFLAKLVQSISKKWGHVYREPSDVEYAWRWEVHHGQTCSETSFRWEASFKNPRRTGALTLENVHFVIEDGVVSKVEDPIPLQEHVDALQLLLHVLSPTRSGVCDELLALIHMGVLAVDERGIPALCHEWWSNVDVLLLDDMFESWGVAADPSGKYGITDAVRIPLNEQWTKAEDGWALGEEDIVYEDSEFDAWRAAFEDKQQAQSDNIEGVGRFGI